MASTDGEFVLVSVCDGELDEQNWVYTWIDANGAVVYVGATGLDPRTRVWLHLHDPDPEVGRVSARFERLADAPLEILAMRVPDEPSRAEVRDVLGERLREEGLLGEDDHRPSPARPRGDSRGPRDRRSVRRPAPRVRRAARPGGSLALATS